MFSVGRFVRRSLAVAVLGVVIATVFAAPDSGASEPSARMDPQVGAAQHDLRTSDAARVLGAQADSLLVGHGDVLRLYWAFFRRDPDLAGATYWLNQFDLGTSIDAIAFSFSESAEFRATYGETGDEEFVRIVYGNVLGRTPDPAGFAYWTELVRTPAVSRVDVVRWISASSEFIGQHPYRRPAVAASMASSEQMAASIDALEALVGQRSTSALASDRSSALVSAVDRLQKRFGRFSSVEPNGQCWTTGRTSKCPVRITEVGLGQGFTTSVANGVVVDIDEVSSDDLWAADALRTAVTGRSVFGSRTLSAADRAAISNSVRRISPTIGTLGQATTSPQGCSDSSIAGREPHDPAISRRACRWEVTGPTHGIVAEVVAHNGRFAGIHVEVPRTYTSTSFGPYATIGDVTLHHPADRVERIGFHESGHDGAQQQDPQSTGAIVSTMASRNRGNGSRTAADIAVHQDDEIRSPVTGTVLRAGTYTLYCKYQDHYLVIEPDTRPGYEVKVLHFEGLAVEKGDRLVAGQTRIGSNVRKLPFESQIDKTTADPSNGHIHIEVVDPSIPDRPSGGGC
ncbi:MAG: DUF4214 domain-containing protein [Acidimicrobiales bacterium]